MWWSSKKKYKIFLELSFKKFSDFVAAEKKIFGENADWIKLRKRRKWRKIVIVYRFIMGIEIIGKIKDFKERKIYREMESECKPFMWNTIRKHWEK
jgi:hypothetical protein